MPVITLGPDDPLNLVISSGVTPQLKPFCGVWINEQQIGQLDPAAVRGLALQWLEAAETAESDALVTAELVETVGLDLPTAGQFLIALRNRRDETPPAPKLPEENPS